MKLFLYLAVFFMFIILLLWIFQVVLMDGFYRAVTVGDLYKYSERIELAVKMGRSAEDVVLAVSVNSDACITLYKIEDGIGSEYATAHVQNGCYVHNLISSDQLNDIHSGTKDSRTGLVTEITSGEEEKVTALLYSSIFTDGDTEYFLLFDTEAFPAGVMDSTVTVQLILITIILLISAAALAVVISRKITHPISVLSRESEELAKGDYTIDPVPGDILEINRLGEALGYAATELERSAKMKQELIANVTHDLRTPLTMISGYSEVMRDIPGEVTPENLQVIIDESARLSALVSDVLEVSKAQNGSIPLNQTTFCISDSVKAISERYAEMLRSKGYSVKYESDGSRVLTYGDETKLMQAFCNLLNNALNFTGADRRVIVRQWTHDGVYRTEVIDFGNGIPDEELEYVWDRYYRARDRHTKGVPGSGLGLSIVKQVLICHDVSFGVDSVVGEGSTFWFEVKITDVI